MVLSNFEKLGSRYKEVTSPTSAYQGQLKGAKFAKTNAILIFPENTS